MGLQRLSFLYDSLVESIVETLDKGDEEAVREDLEGRYPAEIALILEALTPGDRARVWELLEPRIKGHVLHHLHDIARASLIGDMDEASLVASGSSMDVDELAEVVKDLPDRVARTVIDSLDEDERRRFDIHFAYGKNTAGRLMDTDCRSVREDVSIDTVLRYLRRFSPAQRTNGIMVVDRDNRYLGKLYWSALIAGSPHQKVSDVMDSAAVPIPTGTSARDISVLFEQRDLLSVAVVDDAGLLLGEIAVTDVLDLIHDEADKTLMNMAGLEEEDDLFAPVLPSARRRAVWLGINLATAFLAAWVIGLYEETLEQIVALAVLMPIVASMGGIGGSQSLTLAIRGLAMGQINSANTRWLLFKEVAIGVLNGVVWALVVAVIAVLWFGSYGIGAVIGTALLINMVIAAGAGILIPLVLDRLGLDPALSGSVVLTTVTDVVGFMAFLGLGTAFLL